jgi:hypothetical protein
MPLGRERSWNSSGSRSERGRVRTVRVETAMAFDPEVSMGVVLKIEKRVGVGTVKYVGSRIIWDVGSESSVLTEEEGCLVA